MMMPDTSAVAAKSLIKGFFENHPHKAATLLNDFPPTDILEYLQEAPAAVASTLFFHLNPDIAEQLIPKMPDDLFIQIAQHQEPENIARILARLNTVDSKSVKAKLSLLPENLASELKELMSYPPETAGYFMDPRVMTFSDEETIETALARLRAVRRRRIFDLCLVDSEGRLNGTVSLQNVAVADPKELLASLSNGQPASIQAMAPRDEVVEIMEKNKLASLPVVDQNRKLLGVIRYDALVTAAQQDATKDLQAMFGAGRDEHALSGAAFAIRKRLPWLEINLATAFLASAVVGLFEDTIARMTALAIFLPVVAGQSGNTGSQALAVTMRGLALREIRVRHWFQVARKEVTVGFINGCAVAATTAIIVYWWESSIGLAAVIGISMIVSMVIAGLAGAVIPIILKSLNQDPAQSSSIILTTVTDVVGFMSFLGLATLLSKAWGLH